VSHFFFKNIGKISLEGAPPAAEPAVAVPPVYECFKR
jgi:hypothetical protein